MARAHRIRTADHLYHVTARGLAGHPIMATDTDRRVFLATLAEVVVTYGWLCHAYCVMDTHYHLMLRTPAANLPEGMQALNGSYGTRFSHAYGVTGHVFRGRYGARLIRSQEHALEVSRYVPLNPVRAGICREPEDWPWSSYRGTLGLCRTPPFLSSMPIIAWFGSREAYRSFVASGRDIRDPAAAALARVLGDGTPERIRDAHDRCGYPLREIAAHLGIHHTTVMRRVRAGAPKGV